MSVDQRRHMQIETVLKSHSFTLVCLMPLPSFYSIDLTSSDPLISSPPYLALFKRDCAV